jgi:2-polyprenyl-6-methoxyphenol hydroxylase-like FAD-dependent oxidoreductase
MTGMKVAIVGGGIGGLVAALALHRAGVDVHVFETAREVKPLGVGINLLPHCVRVLDQLGATAPLLDIGIQTRELVYFNRQGQRIWTELRGLEAGYRWPQISIHRGELQLALLHLVQQRLGVERVHLGHHLVEFEPRGNSQVTARFAAERNGSPFSDATADVLIGADGIHSIVRAQLFPTEGPPKWNGGLIWRAVSDGLPFLSAYSHIMAGGRQTFVAYPISKAQQDQGRALINWVARFFVDPSQDAPPEQWNRRGKVQDFLPRYEDWRFDWLDIPSVIRGARAVYEFPMVDRDPLARWSFGRVTLLGDAAHPMYPLGSNGASQAILDAHELARALRDHDDPEEALIRYEAERRPKTAQVVANNRRGGPAAVIDMVEERAPNGFSDLGSVVTHEELARISDDYKRVASFDIATVNG